MLRGPFHDRSELEKTQHDFKSPMLSLEWHLKLES